MQVLLRKLLPVDMIYEISRYIAYPDIQKLSNVHPGTDVLIKERREIDNTKTNKRNLNKEIYIRKHTHKLRLRSLQGKEIMFQSEQRAWDMYPGRHYSTARFPYNVFQPGIGFRRYGVVETCCGTWRTDGCNNCEVCRFENIMSESDFELKKLIGDLPIRYKS
jgi:hypothetical protein